MSLSVHAALSNEDLAGLPGDVRNLLREYAAAANEASLALQQAHVLEVRAVTTNDGDAYADRATVRQRLVYDLVSCVLSYRDQLVVTYARVAADYAVFAAQIASCMLAGGAPSTPPGEVTRPSRILTSLSDELPLVQVFADTMDDAAMAEQNVELRRTYTELATLIDRCMSDAEPTDYDDRQAAASRTAAHVDLVVEFPAALHGYAAAITWAIATMKGGLDHHM